MPRRNHASEKYVKYRETYAQMYPRQRRICEIPRKICPDVPTPDVLHSNEKNRSQGSRDTQKLIIQSNSMSKYIINLDYHQRISKVSSF